MRTSVLATMVRWLIILNCLSSSVLLAQVDPKYAIKIGAGNFDYSSTEITYLVNELANTGVTWAFLGFIWGWAELAAPTDQPQGPDSYFGPTVQKYHNYRFSVAFDQIIAALQARNINIPDATVLGPELYTQYDGGEQLLVDPL